MRQASTSARAKIAGLALGFNDKNSFFVLPRIQRGQRMFWLKVDFANKWLSALTQAGMQKKAVFNHDSLIGKVASDRLQ